MSPGAVGTRACGELTLGSLGSAPSGRVRAPNGRPRSALANPNVKNRASRSPKTRLDANVHGHRGTWAIGCLVRGSCILI